MLRYAQIDNVVSQMPQKRDSAIFYKRKRCTTIFFNRIFSKKWGQALCACVGPPGPPPFLGKKFYLKKCCVSFACVKNGTVAFLRHLTYHIMNLCVSEHFQFAKRLKFVLCELSQFPKKRIRVHFCACVLLQKICIRLPKYFKVVEI